MEWKIICAVLCVIGHAAGQAATSGSIKEYNITFSINESFLSNYTNISAPETQTLVKNITTELNDVFKTIAGYQNMTIWKFSNGSIVTEGALQFNGSLSGPDATDVKKVLVDKINSGSLTTKIKNDSVVVTAPATLIYTLKFSILQTFNDTLGNLSSPDFTVFSSLVTTEFTTILKKRFTNFIKMFIKKFSKGSIVTESDLQFVNTSSNPSAKDVAKTIVDAAKNKNFTFSVDPASITVTDPSGNASNSGPPVLCSMLAALWMTLASLLLTGVMHF